MKLNRTRVLWTATAVSVMGLLLTVSAYAQSQPAVTAAAQNAAENAEEVTTKGTSFLSVVFNGTAMDLIVWLMIFLTSLATVALIIDSCVCIQASKIMPVDLIETVKNSLADGDLSGAMEACEATPGPLSNILMSGFNNIAEGYDVVLDSVSSQASIETEKLMQRVNYLNLCGQLAPMFGLMGTVTGMVSAFGSLGTVKGAAQTAALAQSISSALYTTAVGLFIAVPAILGFTFIKNNASKIILMMEAMTYELINTLKDSEVREQ